MTKIQAPQPSTVSAKTLLDSIHLGLDWADAKHDYCILDPAGKILGRGTVKHNHVEITGLIRTCLELLAPSGRIHLACESADNVIGRFLRDFDRVDLHLIHPSAFSHYRQSCRNSKAKNDADDAFLLGDYLRRHMDKLPVCAKGQESELEMTCRLRRSEADSRADHYNRLTATLKMIFPGLTAILAIASPGLLRFLEIWPTLQDFQAASPEQIRDALQGKRLRAAQIHKLLALKAEAQPFVSDKAAVNGFRSQVKAGLKHLAAFNDIIEELENRISELLLDDAPLFQLIDSLPGAGKALVPRLVAAFSSLPEGITREELAAMMGIAPVLIQSGQSRMVRMRMSGRGFTCQTMFEFAFQSILQCNWAKAHYDKQRAGKASHGTAVRSVAMKWLRIIWAMLKSGRPYDETQYLAACQAKRAS
jgi:transposase